MSKTIIKMSQKNSSNGDKNISNEPNNSSKMSKKNIVQMSKKWIK